jgi:hypothetical protein
VQIKKYVQKNIAIANRLETTLGNSTWIVETTLQELVKLKVHIKVAQDQLNPIVKAVAHTWRMDIFQLESHMEKIEGSIKPLTQKRDAARLAVELDKEEGKILSKLNVPKATGLGYKVREWIKAKL